MAYILSVIYYFNFFGLLYLFHPFQAFAHRVLGYKWQMRVVNCMNFFLYHNVRSLGGTPHFAGKHHIPTGIPIIFISNHQSINDIIGFVWNLKEFHPKYISKKELGKGIPSISYNLRHGGSVLIDRNDSRQALTEIAKMGEYIEAHKRSVVIFPEGTRTRTGEMLPFQIGGVAMLLKKSPNAVVVPIALRNLYKLEQHGQLQMPKPIGGDYYFDVLPPISRTGKTAEEIVRQAEASIEIQLMMNEM